MAGMESSDYEGRGEDEVDERRAHQAAEFRSAAALFVVMVAAAACLPLFAIGVALDINRVEDAGTITAAAMLVVATLGGIGMGVGSVFAARRRRAVQQRIRDRAAAASGQANAVSAAGDRPPR